MYKKNLTNKKKAMFEIKSNTIIPKSGRLLLSEPLLRDFYFRRSVIMLIDHNEDGSFGVIINKPLKMKLNEVVSGLPDFDASVFIGGPLASDKVFFLHTLGDEIPDSILVSEGMYWGGDLEAVTSKIKTGLISTDSIRFFMGYSGWTSNQLDKEIKSNSWAVTIPNLDMIMKLKPDKMWKNYVNSLGKEYRFWLHLPKDPLLN